MHDVSQIHGFRLNCWEEHTSQVIELYEKPESTECMRAMNAIGDKGWQDYTSDQVHNMTSHLMTYPIKVCSIHSGGMLLLRTVWTCHQCCTAIEVNTVVTSSVTVEPTVFTDVTVYDSHWLHSFLLSSWSCK